MSQSNSVDCAEGDTEVRWGFVVNGLFQGEHHQDRRERGSTHTLSPTRPGMSAGPPALSPWEGLPFSSQHTITLPASLAARSGQVTTFQPMGCELSDKHHFQAWPIVIFHGQFCLSLSQATWEDFKDVDEGDSLTESTSFPEWWNCPVSSPWLSLNYDMS